MSVLIKNMRMPTSCSECAFCGYYGKGDHVCDITGKEVVYELSLENRLDDCPLVELPPHGRLIDAYELTIEILKLQKYRFSIEDSEIFVSRKAVMQAISDNPTVIEAEGESE